MTLGQFSVVVGAPPRWVQNARAVLRLPARYSAAGARTLALARGLVETCDMPLVRAYPVAARALAGWPKRRVWERVDRDGVVRVGVDLARFLSAFAVRLAGARLRYGERRRGRPRKREADALARARAHGLDLGLLEASLARTPTERLRRLDEALTLFRTARVGR
ncbi:MAG: hypothetical protein ACREMV_10450 [Gemmatimonadales bacterium]